MSRAWTTATFALAGLVVALVVGTLVLRPSGDGLVAAARELVPEGYEVHGQGVDEGNVLLGWSDVGGVRAVDPDGRVQDVVVTDLARAAGWEVVAHEPSDAGSWSRLHRPAFTAQLVLGTEAGEAEATVMVERDGSEVGRIGLAALLGATVGGVQGWRRGRGAR